MKKSIDKLFQVDHLAVSKMVKFSKTERKKNPEINNSERII